MSRAPAGHPRGVVSPHPACEVASSLAGGCPTPRSSRDVSDTGPAEQVSAGDSGGWPWHPPLPATCNLRPFSPQLAGGVILGVALWLRHDPQTTSILYLELGDRPAPNTFYVGECERHWPGSQHGGPSRCLIGSSVRCRQAVREGFQEEAGPEQACCALWWGGGQPGTLALGLRVRRWD